MLSQGKGGNVIQRPRRLVLGQAGDSQGGTASRWWGEMGGKGRGRTREVLSARLSRRNRRLDK